MFEDKPRGVTIRDCSNQDDYFDKHLGVSGRTIRSMFAEIGKTDQRFANRTTIELTDGDETKGDNPETLKLPRKTKLEPGQVKALKAAMKSAKEEIRDLEKQLACAPGKIEKLEAQVRGQEAETNKQAGKALDAVKALKAAKDEIASLKKTIQKLEAELTKRDSLVTSQARTLDDLRKKLEASKNPPASRNGRKALIATKVEARKAAKAEKHDTAEAIAAPNGPLSDPDHQEYLEANP
jgi:predicted  nucleic acid-binding Zn-ribbon protein